MDEERIFTKRFVDCVKRSHDDRSTEDLDFIGHTLKKLAEFRDYSSAKLKTVPEKLCYEEFDKDHILYKVGDEAAAWYYVISGSVMIGGNYLFQTECSFGRLINSNIRADQCHVLEPTTILKICYTPEELKGFAQKAAARASKSQLATVAAQEDVQLMGIHNGVTSSHGSSTKAENTATSVQNHSCCDRPSLENIEGVILKSNSVSSSDVVLRRKGTSSGSPVGTGWVVSKEYPQSAEFLERNRRSRSEERIVFSFDPDQVKSMTNDPLDSNPVGKQQRPMSSTDIWSGVDRKDWRFSAPSGGGERKRNRDSMGSIDYLSEAGGDSDDEESVQSESSSAASMDAVLEVLSKQPGDRTPEDVDRVMDVLQYMPVFSNMTSNIRRALFEVVMVFTYDNENTLVLDNGEDVDKWYVVLNGQFKQVRDSSDVKIYSIGDSFGVSQSMKVLPFLGKLYSAEKTCTLGYVLKDDYSRILTQGEENLNKVYSEDGELEAVFEKRSVDRKEGYFLIQGTPEKLLDELMTSSVDETFVKDFLLTYRTFLKSPTPIVDRLRSEWEDETLRNRVSTVVLSWASEHYSDFEGFPDMEEFLDWFEQQLIEDGRLEEKNELDKSRTSHSKTRNVELDRAGTNSPLEFEVVGGAEVGQPIFIHKVQPHSIPEEAGLRVGDQILQINDSKVDKKELKTVNSILRKNYKLSLVLRSNLPAYRAFIADPPKAPSEKSKTPRPPPLMGHHTPLGLMHSMDSQTMSMALDGDGKGRSSSSSKGTDSPKSKKKTPKIIMPLHVLGKGMKKIRSNATSRSSSTASLGHGNADSAGSGPLKAKSKMTVQRKASVENLLETDKPMAPVRASSLEDIHSMANQQGSSSSSSGTKSGKGGSGGALAGKIVDAVVKLYQPDHSYKYIDITPATTIAELIQQGVKEFYPDKFVVAPAEEYCICMVTITSRNGPIRNSVLPSHMADLANHIGIESRYYLKERAFHGTLVQDEEAEHIFKESRQYEGLLNLKPKQIAEELTYQDSIIFCSIQASEYIADLWRSSDPEAKKNLQQFENIPNDEMYWVVTTVVSETRSEIRAKIIKHFIKVAKWCKEMRNFNTVFHLISGLNHGLVQRLKSTWEKVPHKHKKVFEDLGSFMTPFHNMAKYRELLRSTAPPLIPFFPITKKDLTFLYDGNETQVGGLVNFEKLRMLSQQIRVIKGYCQQSIVPLPPQIDVNRLGGVLKTIHHSIRMRNRHTANAMATLTDNALKEVYNHHRMRKMVQKYLAQKYVIQEEDLLERIADSSEKVVQMRKNPPSPLHRGKRKSGPPADKHRALNMTYSISPSSTTASFGSDSSASVPLADNATLNTPPTSPRKLSAPSIMGDDPSAASYSDKPPVLTGNGTVQVS